MGSEWDSGAYVFPRHCLGCRAWTKGGYRYGSYGRYGCYTGDWIESPTCKECCAVKVLARG